MTDDATQKLVERVRAYLDAREWVVPEIGVERFDIIHDIDLGSRGHSRLRASDVRSLVDALEAAQRPQVSPEQREAIRAVVGEQLTKAGLDLNGAPYSDDGEDQWPLALELRDCLTAALLARFSLPVLDVEKVARVIQIAANSSEDRSPGQTRAEWYAAALVAAIQNGDLT